jgi:hypothetical protein
MAFRTACTVGPSVAGLLLAAFGNATTFWVNAASFLAVIIALWRVRFVGSEGQARPNGAPGGGSALAPAPGGLLEAITYVISHLAMLDLYLFLMLFTFLVFSTMTVYPAFVAETLFGDATVFGFVSGASGAGSLASTLVVLPMVHAVRRTGLMVAGALTWFGVMLVLMTLVATVSAPSLAAAGASIGVVKPLPFAVSALGFLQSLAGPVAMTTCTGTCSRCHPRRCARLPGLMSSISFGMQPFAGPIVGYVGEHSGAATAL